MDKKLINAIALLIGSTIGAGIFAIPYAVNKVGLGIGIIEIILIGLFVMLLNLYYGEVILRTKTKHQITGYAEKYLGKKGKTIMLFAMLFSNFGALTAYLIGIGKSLQVIFPSNYELTIYIMIPFFLGSLMLFFGLRGIEKIERIFLYTILIFVIFLTILSIKYVDINKLTEVNSTNMFLPYGIIFFAFLGYTAIPLMSEELGKDNKKLKKAIILGSLIPLITYCIFTFATITVCKSNTTEIAAICLGDSLGRIISILLNTVVITCMFTSFLTIGLALIEMFKLDYKIKMHTSWIITFGIPMIIATMGIASFAQIIDVVGAISGGLGGIIILMMFKNAKEKTERKPEYSIKYDMKLAFLIYIILILGIAAKLIFF